MTTQKYQPKSLSDLWPERMIDDYGYVWIKERHKHSLEVVGYDGQTEIGSILLEYEDSPEGIELQKINLEVHERAKIKKPNGICFNDIMEEVRLYYETYDRR